MAKQLHILNGDSTADLFVKSGLTGEIAVCREFFCDGPLDFEVGSDVFWKKRYSFFEEEFNVGKLEYFDKSIKEFLKFEDLVAGSELVLWFEFDLFCQVNLLAICTFLLENFRKDVSYYLVCTGYSKDKSTLLSLSDYTADEYAILYNDKVKITKHDLEFAKKCWEVFVKNEEQEIRSINFKGGKKFLYLEMAFEQHLNRFPKKNGLNQIEQLMVESIIESPKEAKEIVKMMLKWQHSNSVYGFGDLQYFWYLKKLKNLYTVSDSLYYINEKGMKLIENGNS